MLYDFPIFVPAGTPEDNPVERLLKMTAGLIVHVEIEFPAGCRGYVSAAIRTDGHQLYPTNSESALKSEDFTVQALELYPLDDEPYSLRAIAWSPDADYDHTLTVRVVLLRLEDLVVVMPFLQGLQKLMEYIGVPSAEKETATTPTPTPTPTPALPVCTLGETKCEDGNLYECQLVEGVAGWVLVEENSPQCAAVQPPGEEPKPEPTPPAPPKPPPVPSEGEILEISWLEIEGKEHPLTDPIPYHAGYRQRFKIKNVGKVAADFRVAYYSTGFGKGYHYSDPVHLVPQQVAYIDWVFYAGAKPASYTVTWHLFSYDQDVYQREATHIIGEEKG